MNSKDISYLLSSYLVIIDGEINDRELQAINKIYNPSNDVISEQNKIFTDADDKLTIDLIINKIKSIRDFNHVELFKNLFSVIYADGFYDSREKAFIYDLSNKIGFSNEKIVIIENEVESNQEIIIDKKNILWTDLLKEAFEALIYELKEDKDDGDDFELLSGLRFIKKVESIAKRSKDDLLVAEKAMIKYNDMLINYFSKLEKETEGIENGKRNDSDVDSLLDIIDQLNDSLKNNIIESLSANLEIINKKKRTINYFTIAFMGRTKAGKSTLHKVVTHEEADDIGVGKIRTTRFNRCWYWENIRIVDTPGIGAPGGKTDTETAKTIIDEADLVCYVVTNDSIQETEFDFLKQLKERNKPLFIILNIKENLVHPARLKRFINDPLKWKTDSGEKNIQGHLDRIKECIGKNYNIDCIEIIPLQLFAAQLFYSNTNLGIDERNALMSGSNIQEFILKIKQSVYKTGNLRKTQNIIDGCNYQIYEIRKQFEIKNTEISYYDNIIRKRKDELIQFILKEKVKAMNSIKSSIENAHKKLRNNARTFSESNYNKDNIQQLWENDEDNSRVFEEMKICIDEIISHLIDSIKERVDECFDDLSFQINQFKMKNSFNRTNIVDWKFGAKILTSIATLIIGIKAGAFLFALVNFWNPVVWGFIALFGLAAIGAAIVDIFKSKEEKIAEAKGKLLKSLLDNIMANETKMIIEILDSLEKNIEQVQLDIDNSFSILLNGTSDVINILDSIIRDSKRIEKEFNNLFAYRILQHLNKLNMTNIEKDNMINIMNDFIVERSYENSIIDIKCDYKIEADEALEISNLLQTKVNFL